MFDSLSFLVTNKNKSLIFQEYNRFFPKGRTYVFSKEKKKGLFAKILNERMVPTRDSILISGVDEFFIEEGISKPIKFRINSKFGYYPFSQNANYLKLGDFKYGYARFMIGKKKEGWINLDGKEFFDQ